MLAKTLGEREAVERALERANNQRHLTAERIKRSNAWFTRKRTATRKDYLAGKAHLCWDCSFVALGHRYELSFVARRADHAGEVGVGKVVPASRRDGDLDSAGDRQDQLVFVGEVEFVDRVEGAVPSLVWLGVPHELHSDRPALSNPSLQPLFQIGFTVHDWEAGVVERFPVGSGAFRDEVIEGGTQVMDRVVDDQRQVASREWVTVVNTETVAITFEVRLEPDLLWMSSKEASGRHVKLGDVAFRPLDL